MRTEELGTGHLQLVVGKNKHMNSDTWFGVFIGAVVLFLVLLVAAGSFEKGESAANAKWDGCVKLMTEVVPDPNDDSRASFLQNCYETKQNAN